MYELHIEKREESMKRLLYLNHCYHIKTKSNRFLSDIFEKEYDVTYISYNPENNSYGGDEVNKDTFFDVIVLFQVVPSRSYLNSRFSYGQIVLFPMYDSFANRELDCFIEFKDCKIINFSSTLYDKLKKLGYKTYYIQYFPKPFQMDFGDEKSVFFWQRIGKINIKLISKILDNSCINHIHLHKAIDPNQIIDEEHVDKYRITTSEWLENADELKEIIAESAYYIAPRLYEGIGMGFLEAMAMGRCVIAPNYPTMNEYIINGFNGILYDVRKPQSIGQVDVRKIQLSSKTFIENGYKKWCEEQDNILKWVAETSEIRTGDNNKLGVEYDEIIRVKDERINKFTKYFNLMDRWTWILLTDRSIEEFFYKNSFYKVAIYGLGKIGDRLIENIDKIPEVTVVYAIDKSVAKVSNKFIVYDIEDDFPEADVVIVTPIFSFEEIKDKLASKVNIPIVSIDEIIYSIQ